MICKYTSKKLKYFEYLLFFLDIDENTLCVAMARIGWDNQKIISGKMTTVLNSDVGPPLHSLVIVGETHFIEADMLKLFAVNKEEFL